MAKIPEELFKRKQRTVADLKPGERAEIPLCMIAVDHDRNAYVFPNAELGTQPDENFEYGEIWRDSHGKYHVDLRETRRIWEPRDLKLYIKANDGLKPIETIKWSPSADPGSGTASNGG